MDLGQVAAMPYYTGLTFKVFGDRVPDAFLSGGRYDQLFKRFGAAELTAIGWSLDIDSVYQAIHDDLPDESGRKVMADESDYHCPDQRGGLRKIRSSS